MSRFADTPLRSHRHGLLPRACARRKFLLGSVAFSVLTFLLPNAGQAAGSLTRAGSPVAPVASSITAQLVSQQQSQAVAAASQNQLSRVTMALQAMQNMQSAARNLALTAPSSLPDGLRNGGLVPNSGLAAPGIANPVHWTNAQTPIETNAAGKTAVTINQTASKALLSWNSFNVSRNTTVNFNQHGNTNWVALNKIAPNGVPSQILGSIKASGQVYLINANGIIFGGSSQINVGALIASSADISSSQFTANGIYSTQDGAGFEPSFTNAKGAVIVKPGAQITTGTPASVTAGGGFVMLLGTQVQNGGAIATPGGQTVLAAGDNFLLRPGLSTTSNPVSTTRGTEIAVELNTPGSARKAGGSGLAANTGIISASTGDITLAGENLQQNGMLLSTTSVATRGTIHLLTSASDSFSSVTLGPHAFTLIEPELASTATELDSQRAAEVADSATVNAERQAAFDPQFDDLSQLGDQEEESRIEIVTGGNVDFRSGSNSSAPGGQIVVSAENRVQAENGAFIDVSGTYGVPLAMSANDIAVNVQSFELRDDPQNRLTQDLRNNTVFVDARTLSLVPAGAAYATDRDYTAGGLLEVSGFLANAGHTIGEYTAIGGSIDLSTGSTGAIVADSGATFNIAGGSLQYSSGYLQQSYLVGTDGHIYDVNTAPAGVTYTGVYNGFSVTHPHWGVTETYSNVLDAPSKIFEQGYTAGRAAGSLTLSSPTTIFNGKIEAGTVNGALQTGADTAGVADPYTLPQNQVAEPGSLVIAMLNGLNLFPADTNVAFAATAPVAGNLSAPIAKDLLGTSKFKAAAINSFGLGGIEITTNGSVDVKAPLVLAAGGQFSLLGSSVIIGASLTTPGGSVSAGQIADVDGTPTALQLPKDAGGIGGIGNTTVGRNVTISTAGLWTNLALDPSITFTQAFINGGAVSLGSIHNLVLNSGSVIDTSAGGVVSANGAAKGGAGGAISLAAATPSDTIAFPTGDLVLDGRLDAIGFTQGGALTLAAPSFLITNAVEKSKKASVVTLDSKFFTQGFSAYNLQSTGNITIAAGTVINVTEPTYQLIASSRQRATGSKPASAFAVALNPLYTPNNSDTAITQRPGASFSATIAPVLGETITRAPVLAIGNNAAIDVDPGQSINLQAPGQMTLDGDLRAPGGAISAVSDVNITAPLPGTQGETSIWVGAKAVIDASAKPVTFSNAGNIISLAPAGGSVTLGSQNSTAAIIIQHGALIEASGSTAIDEAEDSGLAENATALPLGQKITIAGAGGAIALASEQGIYNDGALLAAAGGPNAAGGSLTMILEGDQVLNADGNEQTPRIFTIEQNDPGRVLPAKLQPGASSKSLAAGTAQISAQQIAAGKFGSVTLFSRDAFLFKNNVKLSTDQSISLEQGVLTDSSRHGSVILDAPYVLLSGQTPDNNAGQTPLAVISGFSAQKATGTFTVNAATIDIDNAVRFGGVLPKRDLAGFATVKLNSSGDLRFDAPLATDGAVTNLVTSANLVLTAREIYALASTAPQTGNSNAAAGTSALIVAGYNPALDGSTGSFYANGTLTIRRAAGTTAAAPDSLGGSLIFEAANIRQDGVVWQPLGSLIFGGIDDVIGDGLTGNSDPKTAVDFMPGSLTSVSAAGLMIPFGGTTDGVVYNVDGAPVSIAASSNGALPSVTGGVAPGTITIAALKTNVQRGAVLDLRGGGTLAGEGFISGQGGSSDVLATPLLKDSGSSVTQPGLIADPVYAIIAGAQPVQAVAYTSTGAVGAVPGLGASVIVPAGVPGLAPGRYTLLPASYALMPGGYRVEFDGAASLNAAPVVSLPNGSYEVAGFGALANTNIRQSLASNLTITPGNVVRNDSQYDEENYSKFLVANAASFGGITPVLPVDAGTLALNFPADSAARIANAGLTLFQAASGGIGGSLLISGADFVAPKPDFDIYGSAPLKNLPAGTVSLSAAQIDAFHAFTLELGDTGQGFNGNTNSVTLEKGATLTAARVVITALTGGITLKSGSEIDTLGQGALPEDSSTFGPLSNGGASVLDVGNGYLSYSTAPPQSAAFGPITVQNGAKIYTDGSIAFSTSAAVDIGVNASYGGKFLDLAVPEINIATSPSLKGEPSGLVLTPAVLRSLTQGIPGIGVPAVQIVNLTASDSLNFFGTTRLDLTGGNVQLEINTPAIYGLGDGNDTATISADTIVWNGISTLNPQTNVTVSAPPGGTVPGGLGSGTGTLDLDAEIIVFGYSNLDVPLRDVPLNRLTLGFSTVNLNAGSEITTNNQGSLAVYQTQPKIYGQPGSGGTLNLNTPLLTAGNEAAIGFTAGGAVNIGPAIGMPAASNLPAEAAGGEVDLAGNSINIDGAIILPSGKLNLQAVNNISLGATSLLNLAGVATSNVDQTVYGFGGDLIMDSAGGSISQAPGSVIDVSAVNNTAGSVSISAVAANAGQVSLLGNLNGGATGFYASGAFKIAAQNPGDFTALNASLNAGQFFGARSFDIKQGNLVIGAGVQAHSVSVSLDNGNLTVNGLIDASGNGGGSIDLAASSLTLNPTAVLDAHGTALQVDSYGQPIRSENAPAISLTASTGELILASNARIDLAAADGVARGDLELNVPRLGGASAGDANITAGTVNINGAATIAVNAFETYHGLPDTVGTVTGAPDALITQAYLDQINTNDSMPFMANAAGNGDLAARLAGLKAYGTAFHFRPGVQIVSAPDGDLTVQGDLDLAGYRYGPGVIPGQYGSGEPGVLVIRASGNLNIYGSITDGFEKPASDAGTDEILPSEFANGWVAFSQGEPYGQNQVLPVPVIVAAGSGLSDKAPVNFAVDISGGTFAADAIVPVNAILPDGEAGLQVQGDQQTGIAFIATSAITLGGKPLYDKGAIVPAGATLPDGAVISPGGILPIALNVGEVNWPANTPFTVTTSLANGSTGVVLQNDTTLQAGSFIPSGSTLEFADQPGLTNPVDSDGNPLFFADGTPVPNTVNTRPAGADGTQGALYGLAALLPAGDMSWSIDLTSGADTAAAATNMVRPASALPPGSGNLTLADTHYGVSIDNSQGFAVETVVPAFSVLRTGTGTLNLTAGGAIDENSAFGVYTAGAQSAAIRNASGQNPYNLAQGASSDGTLLGSTNTSEAVLDAGYAANYPTNGGNVTVSAQGDLNGFISVADTPVNSELASVQITDTDAIGGWLWRQGGAGNPAAWWIDYGNLTLTGNSGALGSPNTVQFTGFQGIGTLGGGNLTVNAGGNAQQLNLVVASNGRVVNGALVQDGGGAMKVKIGGTLNNLPPGGFTSYTEDAGGLISDLRGDSSLNVGSVGTLVPQFGLLAGTDPRFLSPLDSEAANLGNGIDLLPGDSAVTINSRGDLVIDGAGNPTVVQPGENGVQGNLTNTTPVASLDVSSGGDSDFSLWTATTGINLFSAGGDVAPVESNSVGGTQNTNTDDYYPPSLSVAAQNGNIYFGLTPIELAPSPVGQLQLLAAGSVIGQGSIISMSGAALSTVATPLNPGISVFSNGAALFTNHNPNAPGLMIDFGVDTPSTALHANDQQPARIYAATGDILDLEFGQLIPPNPPQAQQVLAAKPFEIFAGRDIVDLGSIASPNVILNLAPNDISTVTAGRDIIESSFDIAGPGNLTVQAARNIYEADQGSFDSIGPIFDINPNNRNSGAGIAVLAGVGAAGPDYADFAKTYLDPQSTLSLENASQILAANDAMLTSWLQKNDHFTGNQANAYAFFQTLSSSQQDVFLRQLYFKELDNSGKEFNNPDSVRFRSYILGRDVIAALFPAQTSGDITMFGGSGIDTQFGGSIETLTPGGQTVIGVEGAAPPSSAGFITQGSGDIDIFAQNSVLLGESRVLTTFGGNIVIWSAQGDINAGRGSKTTIDFAPLQRLYDNFGDVSLSPTVPSSGAGIATLNPIPAVPPGNIDLIAPLGTVDAGEAGIRSSGNVNVAALHIVNGNNFSSAGGVTTNHEVSAPNISGLTSSSNAAGAAAQAAESTTPKNQAAPMPSIWIVEILGYGGGDAQPPAKAKKI